VKDLVANLESVQGRIAAAAQRVGRDPADITLVAVTKTQPIDAIQAVYELGLRNFGENRVGEAQSKIDHLPPDCTWHMIGHIQSRKAKDVLSLFQVIHSVDTVKLARRLDRLQRSESPTAAQPLPVLLECNVSGEASKYGFAADSSSVSLADDEGTLDALLADVAEITALPELRVQGLMTMAPIVPDPEDARPVFVRLRQLRDHLAAAFPQVDWHHLSMGMTDDFEVAIEEGATLVRLGRALFDPELPPWRKG
jgi:pyridoxal phosphate enzyme (YggS family)